jgi:hypothetical protein
MALSFSAVQDFFSEHFGGPDATFGPPGLPPEIDLNPMTSLPAPPSASIPGFIPNSDLSNVSIPSPPEISTAIKKKLEEDTAEADVEDVSVADAVTTPAVTSTGLNVDVLKAIMRARQRRALTGRDPEFDEEVVLTEGLVRASLAQRDKDKPLMLAREQLAEAKRQFDEKIAESKRQFDEGLITLQEKMRRDDEAAAAAGRASLLGGVGTIAGFAVGGPVGAAIGGLAGEILGGLFG